MAELSNYCKAYDLSILSKFPKWKLKDGVSPKAVGSLSGGENDELKDTANEERYYLFLHTDYHVTTGIYPSEDIAYDDITPDWVEFCKTTLKFEPPDFLTGQE